MAPARPTRTPRTVLVVAFDGLQLLDLAGPVEVFDGANRRDDAAHYNVRVATRDGRRVRSTSGVEIGADLALRDAPAAFDTLVVVGGSGTRGLLADEPFLAELRRLAARARRVTSVCSGSLLLAAAGLLDGHRATSHWSTCDLLGRLGESIEVEADQIFVHDRDRWTSAGVTAGIDLALALVEDDLGVELAHQIAGWLVVFARRPGGQSQFSAQLRAQAARKPAIAELQRWLPDHLAEDLTVDALARRAAMSPRSFARTFKAETGTTPAAHVEELRVEAARRLLETTDLTVGAVASHVGFRHAETLHRAFVRRVATTPDRYRQHFAHRPSPAPVSA